MVATGFTQHTTVTGAAEGLNFIPPRDVPNAGAITVQPPMGETRRLVGQPLADAPDGRDDGPAPEAVWNPDPDERAEFASLLTCGKRAKMVDVMGHPVGIESINVDDDLLIGLFTKDYLGTESYARAVQLATCAAGVRTVDGVPLYQSLTPGEPTETAFRARLEILRKYHSSVIMGIYPHILNLDVEFGALLEKLGK